jgi:hypothetical protein
MPPQPAPNSRPAPLVGLNVELARNRSMRGDSRGQNTFETPVSLRTAVFYSM